MGCVYGTYGLRFGLGLHFGCTLGALRVHLGCKLIRQGESRVHFGCTFGAFRWYLVRVQGAFRWY